MIRELQKSLDKMHKDVQGKVSRRRYAAIELHKNQTNIVNHTFGVGDFMLRRRAHDRGHRLQIKSFGPKQITKVLGDFVYMVEDLHRSRAETVMQHVSSFSWKDCSNLKCPRKNWASQKKQKLGTK